MSIIGKIFRVCLNKVTPNTLNAWAAPTNRGLKAFINGSQSIFESNGQRLHRFHFGLKHKIVALGYKKTLNEYAKMVGSSNATGKELVRVYNRVPRLFQQALTELAEWKNMGGKIPL